MTRPDGGDLRVVTTRLLGYLRWNGVPLNIHSDPYSTDWMVVTTIAHDPIYLLVDYITSTNFQREPDGSKWTPHTCALGNHPKPAIHNHLKTGQ